MPRGPTHGGLHVRHVNLSSQGWRLRGMPWGRKKKSEAWFDASAGARRGGCSDIPLGATRTMRAGRQSIRGRRRRRIWRTRARDRFLPTGMQGKGGLKRGAQAGMLVALQHSFINVLAPRTRMRQRSICSKETAPSPMRRATRANSRPPYGGACGTARAARVEAEAEAAARMCWR